jgi:kynureninase
LNSGPGSIAGAFVHERHHRAKLPRFAGWWGHDKNERFLMEPDFKPMPSAEAWQLSNAPVFSMAVHRAALDLFDRAGMDALRAKSEQLTGFLKLVLNEISVEHGNLFEIITPNDPAQRGCQLSLLVRENGRALFDALTRNGVVVDWREPNVIRMAPVPLYNSFEDVFRCGEILNEALKS